MFKTARPISPPKQQQLIGVRDISPPKQQNGKMDIPAVIAQAPQMKVSEIQNLCRKDRRFNDTICESEEFWTKLALQRLTDNASVINSTSLDTIKTALAKLEEPRSDVAYFTRNRFDKAVRQLSASGRVESPARVPVAPAGKAPVAPVGKAPAGKSPLQTAIDAKNWDAVKAQLASASPAEIDSLLESAASKGNLELLETLLDRSTSAGKTSALESAALKGHSFIVEILLNVTGPDARKRALEFAKRGKHNDIVDMINRYRR